MTFSRRKFLLKFALTVPFFSACGILYWSCSGRKNPEESAQNDDDVESCNDLSGLSENDIELRTKFAYVEETPIADNQCKNCNLYLPPKEGNLCGGCLLFKGPVYPAAYCTYWAPRFETS